MDERATALTPPSAAPTTSVKADRGAVILTLGIIGLVIQCLFFLGTIAWIMGHNDLKEMKAGIRDASGAGLTKAGMICGIVGTAIAGLLLIWVLFVLMVIGTGIFGALAGAL